MKKINKKEKKVIFMRCSINAYVIEQRITYNQNANQQYKKFSNWMFNKCSKDELNVIKKELEYLIFSYADLKTLIEYKKILNENSIKLSSLSSENEKKLNYYLEKAECEYNSFDKLEDEEKEYSYYNDLLSWYSLKIDNTDKVINNLYNRSDKKKKFKDFFDSEPYCETKWTQRDESDKIIIKNGV